MPLLAMAALGVRSLPAVACIVGWPFKAGKPFSVAYLDAGVAVFRGRAIRYRVSQHEAEIDFAVRETYSGEVRSFWNAVWSNSTFGLPDDLIAFQKEIGDDLVVVVDAIGQASDPSLGLPFVVVQEPCHEPAMQTYEVMAPVLRGRGLIK